VNDNRLGKERRIKGLKNTERLFKNSNSRSIKAFPIRAVILTSPKNEDSQNEPLRMMVSVGKKHFKHAIDRNRVKRQIREAYRKNCQTLRSEAEKRQICIDIAFIWLADNIHTTDSVEEKIKKLLDTINGSLAQQENP